MTVQIMGLAQHFYSSYINSINEDSDSWKHIVSPSFFTLDTSGGNRTKNRNPHLNRWFMKVKNLMSYLFRKWVVMEALMISCYWLYRSLHTSFISIFPSSTAHYCLALYRISLHKYSPDVSAYVDLLVICFYLTLYTVFYNLCQLCSSHLLCCRCSQFQLFHDYFRHSPIFGWLQLCFSIGFFTIVSRYKDRSAGVHIRKILVGGRACIDTPTVNARRKIFFGTFTVVHCNNFWRDFAECERISDVCGLSTSWMFSFFLIWSYLKRLSMGLVSRYVQLVSTVSILPLSYCAAQCPMMRTGQVWPRYVLLTMANWTIVIEVSSPIQFAKKVWRDGNYSIPAMWYNDQDEMIRIISVFKYSSSY